MVVWNTDTKMATLTYDSLKTYVPAILKRIALAGYDNDGFLAPDDAYAMLPACCQYERARKESVASTHSGKAMDHSMHAMKMDHDSPGDKSKMTMTSAEKGQVTNPLQPVYDTYFVVKDALVNSDGNTAAVAAKKLLNSIDAIKMKELDMDVHMVWMKVLPDLKKDATLLGNTQDIDLQRDHFMGLSKNVYALMKLTTHEAPAYYQYCPMANDGKGAHWLSKENTIKNPYFGSQMLTCGKTIETIQ